MGLQNWITLDINFSIFNRGQTRAKFNLEPRAEGVGNTPGREGFPDPPKAGSVLARGAVSGGGQAPHPSARRLEPLFPAQSEASAPFSRPQPLPQPLSPHPVPALG